MKIWSKVHITDKNKDVETISKALTNYLYAYGPMSEITKKYNIDRTDKVRMNQYTANRIAGLLMLYLSKDYDRINDIANKYNIDNHQFVDIMPEIEGYIDRK